MNRVPFKEYFTDPEPDKRDRGYAWHTAIGLQAVDGLKTSDYLLHTAVRNIEGEITFEEANALLQTYYEKNPARDAKDRTEEADKVSARIALLLSEKAFSFTPNEYLSIHRKLFTGIYPHAGRFRVYNITKRESVLNGATVLYCSATVLRAALDYDLSEEKKFFYKNHSTDEIIRHLAGFVSRLWQIHVFGEGNTRTTAVFFIKYLRTLGFDVKNDVFGQNALYFRNSLVRANYNDLKNGIFETTEYLELFLRNLLLNEVHPLNNRALHIISTFEYRKNEFSKKRRAIMKIAMANDHAGTQMKEEIKAYLIAQGYEVEDFGTYNNDSCDLSDYVYPAALAVAKGECDRGIFCDGVGYGSALIANKINGCYAAVCQDPVCAALARQHTDSNILCLGAKIIGGLMSMEIVKTWLTTEPLMEEKYRRRVKKVCDINDKHCLPVK